MSLTKKTLVFLAIVTIGLAASKADSLPETGSWVRTIGTVTYGPENAACYSTCKKGQFCSIRNKVAICKPYCGDGIVVGAEALKTGCDDGNTQAGDGCSKCVPEPLWDCKSASAGSPSVCSLRCGNGIYEPEVGEQCDDQNRENLDGCTKMCKVVLSWQCTNPTTSVTANPIIPSTCTPRCGDGIRVGVQLSKRGCDDGGTTAGDGCSATCQVEPLYICTGTPSKCFQSCGNGILNLAAGEECDNGGTNTDGCKNDCTVDRPNYSCTQQDGKRSICTTVCGDGKIVGTEQCDDGNTNPGDGCNKDCKIGVGWECTNDAASDPDSVCRPKCGDGILVGAELLGPRTCDDGNTKVGDGCENCVIQNLWSCVGAPSVCNRLCGNGKFNEDVGEACDNGHDPNNPDDGCTINCLIDPKWTCSNVKFAKSVCTPKCGDGVKVGAETDPDGCDDANTVAGDGCSATCKVETGYTCTGAGAGTCSIVCGDGLRVGTETGATKCDDGNTAANDGCSGICDVEPRYTCTGAGAGSCIPTCGDGFKVGAENDPDGCDDANTVANDGCSATCKVETGYACTGAGAGTCSIICGDGLRVATETGATKCDDANTAANDGCSDNCDVETGYTCTGAGATSCIPTCGDGLRVGTETGATKCDDGNTVANDGCSATCVVESGYTCSGAGPGTCTVTPPPLT